MMMDHIREHVDRPAELLTGILAVLSSANSEATDCGDENRQTLHTFTSTM